METNLDRIVHLMPPPRRPVDLPRIEHWEHVEGVFGVRLPADFKEFVGRYGSGAIDAFVNVLNPGAGRGLRMDRRGSQMIEIYREIRAVEPLPFPIHPEPGGLLPWADTSNGDTLFWIVDPRDDPDRWRLAISEVRGPGWLTHPGPVTRFIREVLERSFVVDFFPDDFPLPGASFEPFPAPHEPMDPRSWDRQEAERRGPGASDRLRRDLETLVDEHRRLGSPLPAVLRAGLPRAHIQAALSAEGVTPHPDVLELYAWSAGVDGEDAGGVLAADQRLVALEEAAALHRALAPVLASRSGVVHTHPWLAAQDWFPIMRSDTTIVAVICSGDDAGGLRAILEHRAGPAESPTIWTEIWSPYGSLGDALADFVDRLRAGLYRWNAAGQTWEEDLGRLEEFRVTRF
jgi:hypothetical protein